MNWNHVQLLPAKTWASHDALLWLCRWLSGCRSLMRSAHCGSVWTGTCWVDVQWRRPGWRCSPGPRPGAGADASADEDEDGRPWTRRECCFGEGAQIGLMGRLGPWMDPGVPVCPGYPARRKRFSVICLRLNTDTDINLMLDGQRKTW